ncbi:MAG: TetR family transcriptional regulator [Paracoccaceae bacterium]|nr:TetR family transcriptional regulator [Paracoccaceae bacterium]MDG1738827.1 TetR family transcriptional regulator [Paracoccaceae bacterium]MDG2259711.1 TetR family transcriptional regulator [Paracoccaceae bacterium]
MNAETEIPRKRNADATRAAIIEAAEFVFTDRGFDQAGTREIAERAGVNVALINRYFGSKEGLFNESVIPALSVSQAQLSETSDLAEVLTNMLMNKPDVVRFDPIIAMLRSASSETVGPLLQKTLDQQIIQPITGHLDGVDGRERASIALAIFYGYDVLVRMMRLKPYTDPNRQALEARLRAVLTAALA